MPTSFTMPLSRTTIISASCTEAIRLGDDELGGAGDFLPEGLADHGVGAGVHGGGGVVQNEDLGFFQQRTGDAKTLLLTAGDVGAALLDVGVVAVGERADEVVRLREAAGLLKLPRPVGVLIAPSGDFL